MLKIHGGMKISDRNQSVERFRTDDYKIMFATPASAKEGLTLTMANHVIFMIVVLVWTIICKPKIEYIVFRRKNFAISITSL